MVRQDTIKRYEKVKELMGEGLSKSAALEKVGMNTTTFQKCAGGNALVPIKHHDETARYIDIVAKEHQEDLNVFVVICKEHQLEKVMKGFK